MIPLAPVRRRFPHVVLAVCVLTLLSVARAVVQEAEPIAYVGHGAFFDSKGQQIPITLEFVAKAQAWYRAKLLADLNAGKRAEFTDLERRWTADVKAEGQSRLVVEQHKLDWLVANSPQLTEGHRLRGKVNALKSALNWKLPDASDLAVPERRERFTLDPDVEKRLKQPPPLPPGGDVQLLADTTNAGQAYINECVAAGVPIPPPIGQLDPAGLAGWRSLGFIPPLQQFIVGSPAEVRTFQNASGMCIALPRYSDASLTSVNLDGVICLGQTSSKVCFWDNQMSGVGFAFPSGTRIPIGVPDLAINPAGQYQAGGFELNGGSGGVCTDCHAGQNPYIVHPLTDLGGGVLMGDLNRPPLNLPTFSTSRYDPLVAAAWPQNQLSQSPTLVPAVCSGCHRNGGTGGAFPHLSTEISAGYCNTILAQAINKTMPPGAGGSQAANPDVIAFRNWCGVAASAGPSNRGDPHLTTTNGVNYDFQAAGEFTALRTPTTRFELQTRQTPVSTTFVPGANPHTGLSSCVSLNTAVAFRAGKRRVTYQPPKGGSAEQLQLRIDGESVALQSRGIDLGSGNRITRADAAGGLDVRLADGTHLIITQNFWASQGYWYLNVEVLDTPAREGTMGHIPAGDWLPLAPNGASFGPQPASLGDRHALLNRKFADAWRVTRTTSLFDYAPGTSTADFTDRNWPPDSGQPCKAASGPRPQSRPITIETAQRMCRVIEDKTVFANCVLDVTATGDAGVVKAYLRTLQLRANAQ